MTTAQCLRFISSFFLLFVLWSHILPAHAQTPPQNTTPNQTTTQTAPLQSAPDNLILPQEELTAAESPVALSLTITSGASYKDPTTREDRSLIYATKKEAITGNVVLTNTDTLLLENIYVVVVLKGSPAMNIPVVPATRSARITISNLSPEEPLLSYTRSDLLQLPRNEKKTVPFTIAVPSMLPTGTYSVQAFLYSITGTSLGAVKYTISVQGNNGFIQVTADTCQVITKDGEYSTRIAPVVNPSEPVRATCTFTNPHSSSITAHANFVYAERHVTDYYFSKPQQSKDTQAITFAPFETKAVTVTLPTLTKPQVYETFLFLTDAQDQQISPLLTLRWTIRGKSAYVESASLDKTYYKRGERAKVEIVAGSSMDLFWRAYNPTEGTPLTNAIIKATITTDDDRICGTAQQALPKSDMPGLIAVTMDIDITRECINPTVQTTIEEEGAVLASFTQHNTSPEEVQKGKNAFFLPLMIGSFLLLVGIVLFTIKKRKLLPKAMRCLLVIGTITFFSFLTHQFLVSHVSATHIFPPSDSRLPGPGGTSYVHLREPSQQPMELYQQYRTWEHPDQQHLGHNIKFNFWKSGSSIERVGNKLKITVAQDYNVQNACDNGGIYSAIMWFYINDQKAEDLGVRFQPEWVTTSIADNTEWENATYPLVGSGPIKDGNGNDTSHTSTWNFHYIDITTLGGSYTQTFYLTNIPDNMYKFDMYVGVGVSDPDRGCDSPPCGSNDSYSWEWGEIGHVGFTFHRPVRGRVVDSCGYPLGGIQIAVYNDSLPVAQAQKTRTTTTSSEGWWAIDDHVRVYDAYAVRPQIPSGYNGSPPSYEGQVAGYTSAVDNCEYNCHFTFTVTAPTNIANTCSADGTTSTISWNNTGADLYQARVDNTTANGWSGNCDSMNPGDWCDNNMTTTSQGGAVTPGDTYNWWVHAAKRTQAGAICASAAVGSSFMCEAPPPPTPSGSCSASWTAYEKNPRVNTQFTAQFTYAVDNIGAQYVSTYRCDSNGNNCTRLDNLTCSGNNCSVPVDALATANQQYRLKFMINDREGYGVGTNGADSMFCSGEAAYTTVANPTCSATYNFAPTDAGAAGIIVGANVTATVSNITCQNVNCSFISLYDEKGQRLTLVDNGNGTYSATFPAGEYGSHSVKLYVMDNTAYSQLSNPADRTQCGTGTYTSQYGNIYGAVYIDYNGNDIRDWHDEDGNGIRNILDTNNSGIVGDDGDYYEKYTEPLTNNFSFYVEDNRTPKGRYNPSASDPYVIDLDKPKLTAASFDHEANVPLEYRSPSKGNGQFHAFGKADDRRYTVHVLPKTENAPPTSTGVTTTRTKNWRSPVGDLVQRLMGLNYDLKNPAGSKPGDNIDIKYPQETLEFGLVPQPWPIGLVADRAPEDNAIRGKFGISGLRTNEQGSNYYNTLKVTLEIDRGPDIGTTEDTGRAITMVGKAFAADTTVLNTLQERTAPHPIPNAPTNAPLLTQLTQSAQASGGFVIVSVNERKSNEASNATSIRLKATDNSWNQSFSTGQSYIYYKDGVQWKWNSISPQGIYFPQNSICDPNGTVDPTCELFIIKSTIETGSTYPIANKIPIEYQTFNITLFNNIGNKTWGTFEYLLDKSGREQTTENLICNSNITDTCK